MDANGQNQEGARKCVNCQTVEKLELENRRLRKEQDVLFLLMDLGMTAVELWGEQHGLFSGKKDLDKDSSDGNNQIGGDAIAVFLERDVQRVGGFMEMVIYRV